MANTLLLIITALSVSCLIIEVSTSAVQCPGQSSAFCDGCQCCPNGCKCPNANGCPTGFGCSNSGAECSDGTTTAKPTHTTTRTPRPGSSTTKGTTISPKPTGNPNATGKLILDEQFNTLNFHLWKHELTLAGGGNWEFQYYTNNRSVSYVRDGVLYLKPRLTSDFMGSEELVKSTGELDVWGLSPADQCTGNFQYGCKRVAGAGGNYLNPIVSARLRTAEYFSFKYGRVEVRAKLPKGDWLWPAIWMLPRENEYGAWPASGEIDIMESRGNLNYPISEGGGIESFGSTLHFGPDYTSDHYQKAHAIHTLQSGTFNDNFHTFGLVWGPDRIYTYLDSDENRLVDLPITQPFWDLGEFAESYENPWRYGGHDAPFDKEYYLILNLAVGGIGGYFPEGVAGRPWPNGDHAVNAFYDAKGQWYSTWDQEGEGSALQVDSVRVWKL